MQKKRRFGAPIPMREMWEMEMSQHEKYFIVFVKNMDRLENKNLVLLLFFQALDVHRVRVYNNTNRGERENKNVCLTS